MKAATTPAVDPITLTVIWNSLISIADELGVTLRHTAFSEGVREGDDFATALFDRHAVLVAQGNFSPGHLGSMPAMATHVLRYFPAGTLKPGDSVLVNDSFIGAGHFPDTYQIMPVFLAERLIGLIVEALEERAGPEPRHDRDRRHARDVLLLPRHPAGEGLREPVHAHGQECGRGGEPHQAARTGAEPDAPGHGDDDQRDDLEGGHGVGHGHGAV